MALSIDNKDKFGRWQNFVVNVSKIAPVTHWLPVFVGVSISTATLVIWQALIVQERTQIEQMIVLESSEIGEEISKKLQAYTIPLLHMTESWAMRSKITKQEWQSDAQTNFSEYKGLTAIEWLDPSFRVRWVVTLKDREATPDLDMTSSIYSLDSRQNLLRFEQNLAKKVIEKRHKITVTHTFNLVNGDKIFRVYLPIFQGKKLAGFIVGVFHVQSLLDTIFKEENVAEKYGITVFDNEEFIYKYNYPIHRQQDQKWEQESQVNIYGTSWNLRVWPTPDLIVSLQSPLPQVVLYAGLLMSLLLALAVHLAQVIHFKQQHAEASTQKLEQEIADRKLAQDALTESQTRLKLINSISTRMMLGMSVEQIIQRTIQQISEYFPGFRVAFSTLDKQGNSTVIHSIEPKEMPQLKGLVLDLSIAPAYAITLCMHQLVVVENVSDDLRLAPLANTMKAQGTQALINVPFQHPNGLVGLLSFESPSSRKWNENEIATLIAISQYLSILIKNAHTQQERQRTEFALRQSESRLRLALSAAHMDTWDWDIKGDRVACSISAKGNGSTYQQLNCADDSFLKKIHPEDSELVAQAICRSVEANVGYDVEFRTIWPDGTTRWVASKGQVYYDEAGQAVRMAGVDIDITSRKQIEAALRESEERFKTFMNNSPVMAFMKDQEGHYVYLNEPLERVFRVKQTEWHKKTDFDLFSQQGAKRIRDHDLAVLSTGVTSEVLETVHTPDGLTHYWLIFKFPVKDRSGQRLLGGVAVDITQRKRAEEEIKVSLQEKEVLLKEVHHRVKNNLQIIDSLFRHQFRHTHDQQTTEILKECQNRVSSMALLHEKLYQSKDLSKINLAGYIRSLLANLFNSYTLDTNSIDLKVEVDNVFVDFETALPCGLIVNELVSNSLKYAFPIGREGEIQIKFHRIDNQNYMLNIKDNGIGLPIEFDFNKLKSLGLKLVKSLVRQLGGSIKVINASGAEFLITFSGVLGDERN